MGTNLTTSSITIIPETTPSNQSSGNCSILPPNPLPQPNLSACTPWDLTESPDTAVISNYIEESLNIGASNLNVFKLLGVYEQGLLQDLTGNGQAISGGDMPNFPAANAYTKYASKWISLQTGNAVVSSAYIGYDFGQLRLPNSRLEYGIETLVKKDIATIQIKQGCDHNNRCGAIRIERSNDGIKWYGVTQITLPDNNELVTINFSRSVPSRWWRLRPTIFYGGNLDFWVVEAIRMMDYEVTSLNNIQDRILLENRDKNYSNEFVVIKGSYRPIDVVSRSSKFGFLQDADQYVIEVSFRQAISLLGRPFVIGDILQLTAETQYSPTLQPIYKYVEVTDVAWSTNGYTPQWVPTLQRLIAVPALAAQETQDIFGSLAESIDSSGLTNINDGNNMKYQDISNISQSSKAFANTQTPERGENPAYQAELSPELVEQLESKGIPPSKINRSRSLYGIDGMPPNGLPYTEADSFPTNPKDGDYHRLTYSTIGTNIPPRLYRYSQIKGRWIYLETDLRYKFKDTKPYLQEFIDPNISTPVDANNGSVNLD